LYLLLDEDGQERIAHARLLELEKEHCSLALQLAEMDGIGVSANARVRLGLLNELRSIEAAVNWHRERMGMAGPQRVEGETEGSTGDDEPTEPRPVGEEAPE
jgi:hypothetical protein